MQLEAFTAVLYQWHKLSKYRNLCTVSGSICLALGFTPSLLYTRTVEQQSIYVAYSPHLMSSLELFEGRFGGGDLEQGVSAFATQSLTHLLVGRITDNRQYRMLVLVYISTDRLLVDACVVVGFPRE